MEWLASFSNLKLCAAEWALSGSKGYRLGTDCARRIFLDD